MQSSFDQAPKRQETLSRCLTVIVIIVISAGTVLSGQQFPERYRYVFSSAGCETVEFNYDITDSVLALPEIVHQVRYRDPSDNIWYEISMNSIYERCGAITMSALLEFTPPSGLLEWGLRSEHDTLVVSHAPTNTDDSFPVPLYLMADMGSDPIGDTENADGDWLDITHCYVGYSETRFYVRLENASGNFPTSNGLFTFYVYGVGIVDPDAYDSVALALGYASIPLLISPGLFRFDERDSSYVRVGDISVNISDNSLNMSCDIADIVAQNIWTTWPPASGFIGLAPVTATRSLFRDESNDIGKSGMFFPKSMMLDYGSNTAPSLENLNVELIPPDTLVAEVTYRDADDNLPVQRDFILESTQLPLTACYKDYDSGSMFDTRILLTEGGWYHYRFQFSDGQDTVETAPDSIFATIDVCNPGDADDNGIIEITDAVYLISFIFVPGSSPPTPYPLCSGDADCNCVVEISDAVYLIGYVFVPGAPPPCPWSAWLSSCNTGKPAQ